MISFSLLFFIFPSFLCCSLFWASLLTHRTGENNSCDVLSFFLKNECQCWRGRLCRKPDRRWRHVLSSSSFLHDVSSSHLPLAITVILSLGKTPMRCILRLWMHTVMRYDYGMGMAWHFHMPDTLGRAVVVWVGKRRWRSRVWLVSKLLALFFWFMNSSCEKFSNCVNLVHWASEMEEIIVCSFMLEDYIGLGL